MRPLVYLLAAFPLAIGLVACDDRDYEAEIAALQTELEAARADNQRFSTELEQLRAQYQESEEIPGSLEDVQNELSGMVQKGTRGLASLAALEGAAGPEDAGLADEVGTVRQDLEEMMRSLQMVAQHLGIQLREAATEPGAQGAGAGGGPQTAPAGEGENQTR